MSLIHSGNLFHNQIFLLGLDPTESSNPKHRRDDHPAHAVNRHAYRDNDQPVDMEKSLASNHLHGKARRDSVGASIDCAIASRRYHSIVILFIMSRWSSVLAVHHVFVEWVDSLQHYG